tara:strand:+ start:31856 stop:32224 length:369 start_codon:yes stop_codon:yes gene_type:complete
METTGYAITSRGTASRSGRIVRTAEERAAQAVADAANATVRPRETQINRSNTGEVLQPGESRFPKTQEPVIDGVTGNPVQTPVQYQTGVQQAGINWLLPLMIIGGFFVATKLKKKKNVQSAK